jgi:hypothetical protein
MHIIYHCVGGAHSSVIASAIHLNMLPTNTLPDVKEILNIPYFDTMTVEDRGKIMYRGTDEKGYKVYTLSRQFIPHLVIPIIRQTWKLIHGNTDNLMIISTMSSVNFLMRLGGFSSRRMQWVTFGRPIVAKGTRQTYFNLVKIVEDTKRRLQ